MTAAFHALHEMAQKHKVHNRLAAYLEVVNRVAEAVRLRGQCTSAEISYG